MSRFCFETFYTYWMSSCFPKVFHILDVKKALLVPEAAAQMPAHGLCLFLCIYSLKIHEEPIGTLRDSSVGNYMNNKITFWSTGALSEPITNRTKRQLENQFGENEIKTCRSRYLWTPGSAHLSEYNMHMRETTFWATRRHPPPMPRPTASNVRVKTHERIIRESQCDACSPADNKKHGKSEDEHAENDTLPSADCPDPSTDGGRHRDSHP